ILNINWKIGTVIQEEDHAISNHTYDNFNKELFSAITQAEKVLGKQQDDGNTHNEDGNDETYRECEDGYDIELDAGTQQSIRLNTLYCRFQDMKKILDCVIADSTKINQPTPVLKPYAPDSKPPAPESKPPPPTSNPPVTVLSSPFPFRKLPILVSNPTSPLLHRVPPVSKTPILVSTPIATISNTTSPISNPPLPISNPPNPVSNPPNSASKPLAPGLKTPVPFSKTPFHI
ncbi:unnamed protein product, partial [Meganyctiphanes norvegica]